MEKKRTKWLEDAALDPTTGQILAAVWVEANGDQTILDADEIGEAELIRFIFSRIKAARMGASYKVAGFNTSDFDCPFITKRAWVHQIEIPPGFISVHGKWADVAPWMIDIRHIWAMGDRQAPGSLGVIAELLGVGTKEGSGKDFAQLWRNPATYSEAYAYLSNDGRITKAVADRILGLSSDQYGHNLRTERESTDETRIPREDSPENPPEETNGMG